MLAPGAVSPTTPPPEHLPAASYRPLLRTNIELGVSGCLRTSAAACRRVISRPATLEYYIPIMEVGPPAAAVFSSEVRSVRGLCTYNIPCRTIADDHSADHGCSTQRMFQRGNQCRPTAESPDSRPTVDHILSLDKLVKGRVRNSDSMLLNLKAAMSE